MEHEFWEQKYVSILFSNQNNSRLQNITSPLQVILIIKPNPT